MSEFAILQIWRQINFHRSPFTNWSVAVARYRMICLVLQKEQSEFNTNNCILYQKITPDALSLTDPLLRGHIGYLHLMHLLSLSGTGRCQFSVGRVSSVVFYKVEGDLGRVHIHLPTSSVFHQAIISVFMAEVAYHYCFIPLPLWNFDRLPK